MRPGSLDETLPAIFAPTDQGSPEDRVGTPLGGRYRLLRVLGRGGMGTVYEAEHVALAKRFAVKTMRPGMAADPQHASRFMREAQALALLHHPGIVEVFDFGSADGELFLVMELLSGRPLSAWLGDLAEAPPLHLVASLLDQTLEAIEAAHLAGVIHRDLKPDNLFLVDGPAGLQVKIVDFGLAHVDETIDRVGKLTSTGMIAGTPLYMSPEQCRSLSVGPSSDLYSLGCILTELLQGSPPFAASSAAELMAQHMFLPPPPLGRQPTAPPVPAPLEQLRQSLLAKRPERRPASAAEVRRLLGQAIAPGGRQGEGPGDRSARAPLWERPVARISVPPPVLVLAPDAPTSSLAPLPAHAVPGAPGSAASAAAGGPLVALVQAGATRSADPAELGLALASQGLRLEPYVSLDEALAHPVDVLLLDADRDDASALALLARLAGTALARRTIVARRSPDVEAINRLIAAGAADVVPSPVASDALLKRVSRLLRRRH